MPDLYGYPGDLFFTPDCKVANGEFLPDILPLEAETVSMSCENRFRENIITCKDPYKDEFLEEVGGLSLDLPLSTRLTRVPTYIPILDVRTIRMNAVLGHTPVVGITLYDILSSGVDFKAGRMHVSDNIRIRKTLLSGHLQDKRVILFLSGSDTLIESVWHRRRECEFFDIIRDMGFWAVTGFNFSVIGGECAFAQALNLKRSLYSAHLIEQHGMQAIPHIYAISKQQIVRWIDWLEENPTVNYFTMNCQLQKSKADIHQVIAAVSHILSSRPKIHAILQGFPIRETVAFGYNLPRIHIADSQPIKYAQSHKQALAQIPGGGVRHEFRHEIPIVEIMRENVDQRKAQIAHIRRNLFQ